jgi:hypothetical protein
VRIDTRGGTAPAGMAGTAFPRQHETAGLGQAGHGGTSADSRSAIASSNSTIEIMKIIQHLLCATALILVIAGCVSPSKKMQSWVGHDQSELIASWGPPQSTASDGAGGTVLMYTSYLDLGQRPGQIAYGGYGNYYYTAPQERGHERTRMFYVNSDGIIYRWRWQGW